MLGKKLASLGLAAPEIPNPGLTSAPRRAQAAQTKPRRPLGEQRRAGLRELHISPALVPDQPVFSNRTIKACPKLVAAAAGLEERRVDELDVDAPGRSCSRSRSACARRHWGSAK